MNQRPWTLIIPLAIGIFLTACSSGPFKWNQSSRPADVQDNSALPKPRESSYSLLIVPSGAIRTNYVSDKTSAVGGVIGSMVVGPIAGAVGGLIGSTAGSTAASAAEENASKQIDASDITQAIKSAELSRYFATALGDKLNQCGIRTAIHPDVLNPDKSDWPKTHLVLPADFIGKAEPYRFFVEAGVLSLDVRSALKDDTMEGNAFARVYETKTLRQIGRYAYKTGSSGSVTLNAYGSKNDKRNLELQKASQQVALYLAGGIASDMCAIMTRF